VAKIDIYLFADIWKASVQCGKVPNLPFLDFGVWQPAMKRSYEAVEPDVQREIADEYRPAKRGCGVKALARKHGLPIPTVRNIVKRSELHGDPVTERGHRPRVLGESQQAALEQELDDNPLATNRDLAAATDGAIAERTVSDYLARANPPFTTKVIQDQEPEEMTDDWKAAARGWVARVKKIPLGSRVYMDEAAIYDNDAPKRGRSRRGKPIFRPRPRYGSRYTLHVFAKRTGVVHWELSKKNADTKEVQRVAAAVAPKLTAGDVLIWDRLGRSGRCAAPVAQHYNPDAVASFEARGVSVQYLPAKGKYFNPLELLFNDLKTHYIRPAFPGNGEKLGVDALKAIIQFYMQDCAAEKLPGFFVARANGAVAIATQLI
jgi:transposase